MGLTNCRAHFLCIWRQKWLKKNLVRIADEAGYIKHLGLNSRGYYSYCHCCYRHHYPAGILQALE